jgi:hypothetical protein
VFDDRDADERWEESVVVPEPWRGACATADGTVHAVSRDRLYSFASAGRPTSVPLVFTPAVDSVRGIRCAGQKVLAFGGVGGSEGFVAHVERTGRASVQRLPSDVRDVAVGPQGVMVAVGERGIWLRRGAEWEARSLPDPAPVVSFRAVAFDGATFAAAGRVMEPASDVVVFGAANGEHLTLTRVPTVGVSSLARFAGAWFVGAQKGEVWKWSGQQWTRATVPLSGDVVALNATKGTLTVWSEIGATASTDDGQTWTWSAGINVREMGHEVVSVVSGPSSLVFANFFEKSSDFTRLFKN